MSEQAVPAADAAARLPTLAVATIGHVRSGKTSVVAALTLVAARLPGYTSIYRSVSELDRRGGSPPLLRSDLADEREAVGEHDDPPTLTVRGTKEVFALPSRRVVAIDCPGRRPWLKNVARGLAVADALLLVVSAPDSVQSQTEEHLRLARALGHEQVVVFLNKCDEVFDLEWLDLVERDVRETLERCGFDGDEARILRGAAWPVLAGESAWEASLRDLLGALETDLSLPQWTDDGAPLIYLDRCFRARRPNNRVLVEGRVRRGSIAVGDSLRLCGLGMRSSVVVSSIENFHRRIHRASAGEQIGMLIYRPDDPLHPYQLRSGQALVAPAGPPTAWQLEVELDLLGAAENGRPTPLREGHDLLCIFGTVLLSGWLRLEGRPPIAAGERGRARIHLRGDAYLEPGMTFALRDGNQGPWSGKEPRKARWGGLVGSGRILAAEPVNAAG